MMPVDAHLNRIEREAGVPGLAEALADMAPTDLKSLLLHVFERQAQRRDPAMLLAQYERDGTVGGGAVRTRQPPRCAPRRGSNRSSWRRCPARPQRRARAHPPEQRALDDPRQRGRRRPTASLALEAAVRRRRGEETVRLCALGRILRLQPVPDLPGYTPHFRLFALVTAGRAEPSHGFEREALSEHLAVYRRLLDGLGIEYRCEVAGEPRLDLPGTTYYSASAARPITTARCCRSGPPTATG